MTAELEQSDLVKCVLEVVVLVLWHTRGLDSDVVFGIPSLSLVNYPEGATPGFR